MHRKEECSNSLKSCYEIVMHLSRYYELDCGYYFKISVLIVMHAGTCDNCTSTKKESDMSREAFLLMACIQSCGGHWGLNLPVDVLRGSRVSFPANNR